MKGKVKNQGRDVGLEEFHKDRRQQEGTFRKEIAKRGHAKNKKGKAEEAPQNHSKMGNKGQENGGPRRKKEA